MTKLPQVGEMFEGYEVQAHIGSGNMGRVYKVRNSKLGRDEALKIVPLPSDPDVAKRMEILFHNEMSIAATVRVPNIVTVFDGGRVDTLLWFTMTLIEGQSLGAELAEYPPRTYDKAEVVSIGAEIATALDRLAMYEPAVIHGDVKPSNIVVERNAAGLATTATLVDFGVSTATEMNGAGLTKRVAGSLPYMAPEVLGSGSISSASDQYAFACTIFELLQGYKAFPATDVSDARQLHNGKRPTTQRGAAVDAVFAQALAVNPNARYSSCSAFIGELNVALNGRDSVAEGRRIARRRIVVGTVLGLVVAATVGGFTYLEERGVISNWIGRNSTVQPIAVGGVAQPLQLEAPDLAKGPQIPVGEDWKQVALSELPLGSASWQSISVMPTFNAFAYERSHWLEDNAYLLPFRYGIDEERAITDQENSDWRAQILDAISESHSVAEPSGSEVIKLQITPEGRRLDVLQTSGSYLSRSRGSDDVEMQFCMVQPADSVGISTPEVLRPVFVVISADNPCAAAYDAVAAWALQTTSN